MMTPSARLKVISIMVVLAVTYGWLVAFDKETARAIAVGYIGLVLTAFTLTSMWRKPQ